MKQQHKVIQPIVEGGLMVAVATLLSIISFIQMPQGGSITVVSMLPIVLFSVRWGWKKGLTVGLVYGLLQAVLGGLKVANWPSILLDYGLAFMVIGFAGLFFRKPYGLITGGLLAGFLRFLVHYASGIILYAEYATGPVWLYSLTYNGAYMLPEVLILVGVAGFLSVPLRRFVTGEDIIG